MNKKNIAIFSAVILIIAFFAGCNKDKNNVSSKENPPSNIESYAKVGRIDTLNVKIGDSVESVCEHYGASFELVKLKAETEASNAEMSAPNEDDSQSDIGSDSEEQTFDFEISYSTENELGKLTVEGAIYYFNESNPEKGIILIVAFDDPYLLTVGSATPEIVEAMIEDKPEYSGETVKDDWFFIFGEPPESTQKIIYSFSEYKVQFMFQENLLFSVMLYDSGQWDSTDTESSAGASSQISSQAESE